MDNGHPVPRNGRIHWWGEKKLQIWGAGETVAIKKTCDSFFARWVKGLLWLLDMANAASRMRPPPPPPPSLHIACLGAISPALLTFFLSPPLLNARRFLLQYRYIHRREIPSMWACHNGNVCCPSVQAARQPQLCSERRRGFRKSPRLLNF